jgi:hypothetical protein
MRIALHGIDPPTGARWWDPVIVARTVVAPDHRTWTVRIRWLSWRPRTEPRWWWKSRAVRRRVDRRSGWWDVLTAPFDLVDSFWLFVALIVLAFLIFFVLPVLVFLVELLLFGLAVAVVIVARVLLRRPWTVEAFAIEGGPVRRWLAADLGTARRAVRQIAGALERGQRHVQPEGTHALGEGVDAP